MYLRTLLLLLCATPAHANLPLPCAHFYTQIHTAEINTYGPVGTSQACILFRNSAGMIMDWRWWNKSANWPAAKTTRGGIIDRNCILWTEKDQGRLVRFKHIRYTRTLHDVEQLERQEYPDHKRVPLFKN